MSQAPSPVKSTTFVESAENGEPTKPPPTPSFPPYPPYANEPVPPSVAETIMAGRDIRYLHKNTPEKLKRPVRPVPSPAKPRGPKATDVKLSKRAARAHARCLRRHNAVLTDRLEHNDMSKPRKRNIIYLWREYWKVLPADTIARLRSMLDVDVPFKPDQAFEYFINLRNTKKKNAGMRVNEIKKDAVAMVADKRFVWARNATVALARGIQQRLSRPGRYALADRMLRLSNIILDEVCGYMHVRKPSRCCTHSKAKFMMEMSDKIAIWIDDILSESDDRMLMMDFDEDYEVLNADGFGGGGFADDVFDMMGGARGHKKPLAYRSFSGEKAEAFTTLTDAMYKKGSEQLLSHGKFNQTYKEGADVLKKAENFNATGHNNEVADRVKMAVTNAVKPDTPKQVISDTMKDMVDLTSKYLAQNAEFNKDKGQAFNLLIKEMKKKDKEVLYADDLGSRTFGEAAKELQASNSGLQSHHDDPNLSQAIHTKLSQTVAPITQAEMKDEMADTVGISSKFLSEKAVNDKIRSEGGVVTEDGYYVDGNGVRQMIAPGDTEDNFYIDEQGIRRLKNPGEDTYIDEQGVRRKGKKPMATTVTEEGYYVDEQGMKRKIGPREPEEDFYVDENGVTRKKNLGEETYIDEQGIRRKVKKPLASPVAKEEYYVDEQGIKRKIGPGESEEDFYIDENGVKRKKKLGEETFIDNQGVRRKGKKPMALTVTEEGYYIDEQGIKRNISPGEAEEDFYVDENGVKRKKNPGEKTYIDEQGIRRIDRKYMAATITEEGYYVDEQGVKKKIGSGESEEEFYVDEKGIRRKKKPGEETYVDAQGVRRKKAKPVAAEAVNKVQRSEPTGRSGGGGTDTIDESEQERAAALGILHKEFRSKGSAVLYSQPHTVLTHEKASKWLKEKPPMKVDKTVRESADTARLHKKFERKLSELVSKKATSKLEDAMQDVVIESSRILSEYFVANNYKALVTDCLISEMQRKGNEILVEVDDNAETFFFAAQRLKNAENLDADEPCDKVAHCLTKQLEDIIKRRPMARKMIATMKEHIIEASDYLSAHVTKPDERIEAYVALLGEMETKGDALLVEGNIPKSFKSSAAYLRQLTSNDDHINRSNSSLKSSIESKLKSLMANIPPRGYSISALNHNISEAAKFLVSYIMLQGEKTEALKVLIEKLSEAGQNVLLRHGTIRKTCAHGAEVLRGKNADQVMNAAPADPVVARKIQIKLVNLIRESALEQYLHMDEVIEDTTMYLANHLLQPKIIQVCKCMKNVFVQCELWCDEILRRVARPCCTCSRHVSAQALSDLAPGDGSSLRFAPSSTLSFGQGIEVSVKPCPSVAHQSSPCDQPHPAPGCPYAAASYMVYSTSCRRAVTDQQVAPERSSSSAHGDSLSDSTPPSSDPVSSYVAMYSASIKRQRGVIPSMPSWVASVSYSQLSPVLVEQVAKGNDSSLQQMQPFNDSVECEELFRHMPPSMFAPNVKFPYTHGPSPSASRMPAPSYLCSSTASCTRNLGSYSENLSPTAATTKRQGPSSSGYERCTSATVSTDQMSDWHAMMISLMWNVQAWRDWIQENIDRALAYEPATTEVKENWSTFQRRVATEALQWRQYNTFSRQLTLRLVLRYKDKQIMSPNRATNRTATYKECQEEMLEIIGMFNRWTQWLTAVLKETDSLTESESEGPLHEWRWMHFKLKVEEYAEDWNKYNTHMKQCWEQKYSSLIADWLPTWKQPGPVWVVSACGAVPSGAVAAGLYDQEVVWVARTTHRCNILPAALHPSKHCCIVYADGAVHHYTKYQVMCNADAAWVPCRAGAVSPCAGAVRVAPGVHAGRVLYRGAHLVGAVHAPHYRCHVVIFGRPFAFNCYELLVLADK